MGFESPRRHVPEARGRVRRLTLALVALGLSLLLTVLLVEALLRVTGLAPAGGLSTVTEAEFEQVPGIYGPHQSLVRREISELPHRVTINGLGYRGEDFPRAKPEGELRILFVGDSFTFGDHVHDEEALPARLEEELSERCSRIRVINAGLPGSTIVTHRAMAERGLELEPDLVLHMFSENDVTHLAVEPMWDQLARNRELKSGFPLGHLYPVARETALWNLALQARFVLRARAAERDLDAEGEARPALGDGANDAPREATFAPFRENVRAELRPRYRQEFEALADTLRDAGLPFVFTAFPSHHTLAGDWPEEQIDWVHQLARDAGADDVELTEALRESGEGEGLFLLPYDGHPSPKGYQVAADALVDALVSHPALGGHCPESP